MTRTLSVLLIVTGAFLAGCQGTTTQGTLYTVKLGAELETFLPAGLKEAHEAALTVVKDDFGYTVEESALDAREGIVKARTARGDQVRVETYMHGDRVTKIEVTAAGSEPLARDILSKIEERVR